MTPKIEKKLLALQKKMSKKFPDIEIIYAYDIKGKPHAIAYNQETDQLVSVKNFKPLDPNLQLFDVEDNQIHGPSINGEEPQEDSDIKTFEAYDKDNQVVTLALDIPSKTFLNAETGEPVDISNYFDADHKPITIEMFIPSENNDQPVSASKPENVPSEQPIEDPNAMLEMNYVDQQYPEEYIDPNMNMDYDQQQYPVEQYDMNVYGQDSYEMMNNQYPDMSQQGYYDPNQDPNMMVQQPQHQEMNPQPAPEMSQPEAKSVVEEKPEESISANRISKSVVDEHLEEQIEEQNKLIEQVKRNVEQEVTNVNEVAKQFRYQMENATSFAKEVEDKLANAASLNVENNNKIVKTSEEVEKVKAELEATKNELLNLNNELKRVVEESRMAKHSTSEIAEMSTFEIQKATQEFMKVRDELANATSINQANNSEILKANQEMQRVKAELENAKNELLNLNNEVKRVKEEARLVRPNSKQPTASSHMEYEGMIDDINDIDFIEPIPTYRPLPPIPYPRGYQRTLPPSMMSYDMYSPRMLMRSGYYDMPPRRYGPTSYYSARPRYGTYAPSYLDFQSQYPLRYPRSMPPRQLGYIDFHPYDF